MSVLEDSRRTAMNIEEAALLPAQSRRTLAGGAALQSILCPARAMDGMTLSNMVSTAAPPASPALPAIALSATSARYRRAALHHVLCK